MDGYVPLNYDDNSHHKMSKYQKIDLVLKTLIIIVLLLIFITNIVLIIFTYNNINAFFLQATEIIQFQNSSISNVVEKISNVVDNWNNIFIEHSSTFTSLELYIKTDLDLFKISYTMLNDLLDAYDKNYNNKDFINKTLTIVDNGYLLTENLEQNYYFLTDVHSIANDLNIITKNCSN